MDGRELNEFCVVMLQWKREVELIDILVKRFCEKMHKSGDDQISEAQITEWCEDLISTIVERLV